MATDKPPFGKIKLKSQVTWLRPNGELCKGKVLGFDHKVNGLWYRVKGEDEVLYTLRPGTLRVV